MDLRSVTGFDWDEGNFYKNDKHDVSPGEIERVFINRPLLLFRDALHSQREERFVALGKTDDGDLLAVVFSFRQGKSKIRPISARPMDNKERRDYEKSI
jgi:uncharacterized protein